MTDLIECLQLGKAVAPADVLAEIARLNRTINHYKQLLEGADNRARRSVEEFATMKLRSEGVESERAANALLTEEVEQLNKTVAGQLAQIQDDRELIEQQRTENEALRRDAERYRWLRDMDEDPAVSLAAIFTDCQGSAQSISNRIDAAVDRAMKETPK